MSLTAKEDRGGISDAWPDGEDAGTQLTRPEIHVLGNLGTRSDEAHGTAQHVDQLGQLVELGSPEEPAHTCDPRIHRRRHREPCLANTHGAKLVDAEVATVQTDARLPEEDGTG